MWQGRGRDAEVCSRDLLRHAGELAGGADAAGAVHLGVWLVGLDVAPTAASVVHIGVVGWWLLVRGVGRGVRVGGTSAAACRGTGAMVVIWKGRNTLKDVVPQMST